MSSEYQIQSQNEKSFSKHLQVRYANHKQMTSAIKQFFPCWKITSDQTANFREKQQQFFIYRLHFNITIHVWNQKRKKTFEDQNKFLLLIVGKIILLSQKLPLLWNGYRKWKNHMYKKFLCLVKIYFLFCLKILFQEVLVPLMHH